MPGYSFLKNGLFALVLVALAGAANADPDASAPLKNTAENQTIMQAMLASARDGHLYRILPASSRVTFSVNSAVGPVEGRFKRFKGGLTFAPTAGDQQAMMTVDSRSLETTAPLVGGMLKGKDFFDVNEYPEILFVSRQFHWVNNREAWLIGDLTLRGVTRRVGFHVRLIDEQPAQAGPDTIQVRASTLISREQFGLKALSPVVGDAVSLYLTVEAVRNRSI